MLVESLNMLFLMLMLSININQPDLTNLVAGPHVETRYIVDYHTQAVFVSDLGYNRYCDAQIRSCITYPLHIDFSMFEDASTERTEYGELQFFRSAEIDAFDCFCGQNIDNADAKFEVYLVGELIAEYYYSNSMGIIAYFSYDAQSNLRLFQPGICFAYDFN